jgi:hypothetical protein
MNAIETRGFYNNEPIEALTLDELVGNAHQEMLNEHPISEGAKRAMPLLEEAYLRVRGRGDMRRSAAPPVSEEAPAIPSTAASVRAEFIAAFGEERGAYWFDSLVFVKDLADERSAAMHEAESLRRDMNAIMGDDIHALANEARLVARRIRWAQLKNDSHVRQASLAAEAILAETLLERFAAGSPGPALAQGWGEPESLRQQVEDARKAMNVIANSYPAEPYRDNETIPGTSLPTNRRIAREFLTYELPGDEA